MGKEINKIFETRFLVLTFFTIIATACNTHISRKEDSQNHGISSLKINDSAKIVGMNTRFIFAKDTLEKEFVQIVNTKNGSLLSKNNHEGIGRYLNVNNIGSVYFSDNTKKMELYYRLGMGISNSLQMALNMAGLDEPPFNRSSLDSFFRYHIFGMEAFRGYVKLYDTLPSRIELVDKSLIKLPSKFSAKCDSYNLQYLSDFYNYLKKNEGRKNFFLYRAPSGVSGTGYLLITVNEEFKSDSLAQKFYENYAYQAGFMYSVKCYFPYYIIEEGGY